MIMRKDGKWESSNHHPGTSRDHRDLFVWPFVLGECHGSCGRGRLGFHRRCRSGLDCARDTQAFLTSSGFDRQFAYCHIPHIRGQRYFCYDPTKLKKKCFTTNSELKSAVSLYNASNTIQTYGHISDWCVGLVTDFSLIFYTDSANSFNEDISKWNTSSATNMFGMFLNSVSFNQDISTWDVSKVTVMFSMFYNANSFNQDISKWDVATATDTGTMFYNATSFNKDISQWDVSKVTSMNGMFVGATSFNQDISKWNISKVTDAANMFYEATSFNQDLSSWDISQVTSIYQMFNGATSFHQNLCSWNAKCQSLIDSRFAFSGASNCPNQTNPICGSGPFCYNCN